MKEATGEGSMTIITIVIIVGLLAAAGAIVLVMTNKAQDATGQVDEEQRVDVCPGNTNYNEATHRCE